MKNAKRKPTEYSKLKKRLLRDFERGVMLGDIKLSDAELDVLALYTGKCVRGSYPLGEENLPVAVFLVAVGARYYDGGYWNHVSRLCKTRLGYKEQLLLGDAFYSFASRRGTPVYNDVDRVKNILAQCLVPDFFRDDLYSFLFYHYFVDLDRSLKASKRRELYRLFEGEGDNSDRTRMITRGMRDYAGLYPTQTNKKLYRILSLMDRYFRLDRLPARLSAADKSVTEWCENDETFRRESKKGNFGDRLIKNYAFSQPYVTFEDGGCFLWLPSLMFRAEDGSDADGIAWVYGERVISYPAATIGIAGIKTEIVKFPLPIPPPPGAFVTLRCADGTEKRFDIVSTEG